MMMMIAFITFKSSLVATSPTLADKPVLQKQFQKTKKLPGRQSRGAKLGGNDGLHVKKTRREWQSAQDSD